MGPWMERATYSCPVQRSYNYVYVYPVNYFAAYCFGDFVEFFSVGGFFEFSVPFGCRIFSVQH